MSQPDSNNLASAINLSQIAQHPDLALAALVKVVEKQESEISLLQENQAILFGLIARLKDKMGPELQPAQKDRGEVLRALLAANGGKMFAKDARQTMRLTKSRFSELLSVTEDIEVKEFHLDKRKHVLTFK